jgi:hypothetical protein
MKVNWEKVWDKIWEIAPWVWSLLWVLIFTIGSTALLATVIRWLLSALGVI